MFFDIGPLELVTLIILAVLVFGPDKLPKVIQDAARIIRKVREFSDSAKDDIRKELGPEFKDFEFEDLNPKNFARKHLLENEDIKELRNGFDLKKEMAEVTEAAKTVGEVRDDDTSSSATSSSSGRTSLTKGEPGPDLRKDTDGKDKDDRPPYDADAT
ncbi:Sec-independent protein translocase subunit TatB [Streptomyces sp. A7024]|uniref:Sec-independent protein translocase protein TatB n=1 Tax=Streptomyces coryli TaxID=1128680 RepID=A0A6G4U2S4_9ACTN|nr:Sec-independent protein translocase subunit TatB [Streptomyces coryli]